MDEPRTAGKTILLCEDDAALRELMRVALGNGYRFVEAVDGFEAIRLVHELRPDLVLLDLMLPGKTGFEVLAEIRRERTTGSTAVVVVTAWSHDREGVLRAGADEFLAKPFDPDELRGIVESMLEAA